jgi:hypothetical protein
MPESANSVIPDRTPAWVTAWIVRADVRSSSEPAGGLDDRSTAHVRSERAARYAKQLVEHLGRRVPVREESAGRRLAFDNGDCLVSSTATELVLTVNAVDGDARAFVEDVWHVTSSGSPRSTSYLCAGWSTPPDRHGQCRQTLSY